MVFFFVLLFLSCATGLALCSSCNKTLKQAALIPIGGAFVLIYLFSGDELAQDRSEYYSWYLRAETLFQDPTSRDWLFSGFLALWPNGLMSGQFEFILSSVVFILLGIVLVVAVRQGFASWVSLPTVLLLCVCDRFFLDLVLNTTRSSLAALLFLLSCFVDRWLVRGLILLVAFGFHSRICVLLAATYALFGILRFSRRLYGILILLAVAVFLYRVVAGGAVIPQLEILDGFLAAGDSESVERGLKTASELTGSQAMQIAMAVVVPLLMLLFSGCSVARVSESRIKEARGDLFGLAVGAAVICLLLYPDLAFIQRLFVIPIVVIPMYMAEVHLRGLMIVKLAVLCYFLPRYLIVGL